MFGLFKKKSGSNSTQYCLKLAQEAEIFVILKNGQYDAFYITLPTVADRVINHFSDAVALDGFKVAINERINAGQYEDPGAIFVKMRERSGWKPALHVMRKVADSTHKPLFKWQP